VLKLGSAESSTAKTTIMWGEWMEKIYQYWAELGLVLSEPNQEEWLE